MSQDVHVIHSKTPEVLKYSEGAFFSCFQYDESNWPDRRKHRQTKYLFEYLSNFDPQTIVLENEYTDGDFLEDFAAYYVRCHSAYTSKCKRLHVFLSDFSSQNLLDVIECEQFDSLVSDDNYVGFIVIRPLPQAPVGRTVLKTFPSDHQRRKYPVTAGYKVHIFGKELSIVSLAYQQQDTVSAACATVSLWSAFQKTAKQFDLEATRPVTITKSAGYYVEPRRVIPNSGLSINQMVHAIRQTGLSVEVYQAAKAPISSLMYGYMKYGLPVVMTAEILKYRSDEPEKPETIGFHAITICGYSIRKEDYICEAISFDEENLGLIGQKIDAFYGHDDQIGPFARHNVVKYKTREHQIPRSLSFEGTWGDKDGFYEIVPFMILIPVYNKIRVRYTSVVTWVSYIKIALAVANSYSKPYWHIYLADSHSIKNELLKKNDRQDKENELLLKNMPRFVWVALFYDQSDRILEILFDATDIDGADNIIEVIWSKREIQDNIKELLESDEELSHAVHEKLKTNELYNKIVYG